METATIGLSGEMTFSLKGAYGQKKKLWQENRLGKFIRTHFGLDLKVMGLGRSVDELVVKNLITTTGKALTAGRINASGAPAAVTYLAVGIGTTAANAADTALEDEIVDSGLERAAATCTLVTTTTTNDTAQLVKSWSVTGSKAVTECGAFNDATTGTILGRQVFSAINVISGDTLAITYKFKVS